MTNRPNGTLYIGVTNDLVRRAWDHRMGLVKGYRLVYFELHEEIGSAIRREQAMKHWSRAWKVNLILAANPYWIDLYERLA